MLNDLCSQRSTLRHPVSIQLPDCNTQLAWHITQQSATARSHEEPP
jgi:hypothetical protein